MNTSNYRACQASCLGSQGEQGPYVAVYGEGGPHFLYHLVLRCVHQTLGFFTEELDSSIAWSYVSADKMGRYRAA